MSLYIILKNDLKEAMKRKDSRVVSVLRMVLASIKNAELGKRFMAVKGVGGVKESGLGEESGLTDEEIIKVLARESKKRKEAIDGFLKGGRKEMAFGEEEENKIIEKYLPKQLSEAEINEEIEKVILDGKFDKMEDFGRAMGLIMAKLNGRAGGEIVGRLLKNRLQLSFPT